MVLNNHQKFLKELFKDKASFYTAIELSDILCGEFSIKSNYARQIISRAAKNDKVIKSSKPFKLAHNQYYYMHPSSSIDFPTLINVSKKYKKALYRLLFVLDQNEGIISMYEARKLTSTPVYNQDKYKLISLRKELALLISLDIVIVKTDKETGIEFIIKKSEEHQSYDLIKTHREKMNEDAVFVVDIIRWFTKRGFITGSPIYRNKKDPSKGAVINDFLFDVKAFTQTTGFNIGNSDSQNEKSLVCMDILLYRQYRKIDLDSFYDRVQSIRHSTKPNNPPRKVMPIVIYQDVDEQIKTQLNNLHILHFSLQDVLGINAKSVLKNIQSLRQLIEVSYDLNKEESIKVIKTVQESLGLIEKSGQEDNMQNVKGDMFETLLFTIFTSMFPQDKVKHSVFIRKPDKPNEPPSNKEYYEYDLVVERNKEIIIIELKGLKNSTIINLGPYDKKDTVAWFMNNTFLVAKEYYKETPSLNKSHIKACYITSANFSKESLEKLNEFNASSIKPNDLDCFYDGKKLLKLLKENDKIEEIRDTTKFVETLERYYL